MKILLQMFSNVIAINVSLSNMLDSYCVLTPQCTAKFSKPVAILFAFHFLSYGALKTSKAKKKTFLKFLFFTLLTNFAEKRITKKKKN